MNVEEVEHVTEVYHIDIGGQKGSWFWDFGTFTLIGSEEYPAKQPGNMIVFSAVLNDLDAISMSNREPTKKVDMTLYVGDYVIYAPTFFDNASHFISPDLEIYKVIEDDAQKENEPQIVLQKEQYQMTSSEIFDKKEIVDEWTPVFDIS